MNYEKIADEAFANDCATLQDIIERACLEAQLEVLNDLAPISGDKKSQRMKLHWSKMTERERDAAVAEHVMRLFDGVTSEQRPKETKGYRGQDLSDCWILVKGRYYIGTNHDTEQLAWDDFKSKLPKFTTEIIHAFAVVEKMRKDRFLISLEDDAGGLWYVTWYPSNPNGTSAESESLPEAIAIAALRAKGIEVDNE